MILVLLLLPFIVGVSFIRVSFFRPFFNFFFWFFLVVCFVFCWLGALPVIFPFTVLELFFFFFFFFFFCLLFFHFLIFWIFFFIVVIFIKNLKKNCRFPAVFLYFFDH